VNSKEEVLAFLLENMSKKISETVLKTWFEDARIVSLDEEKCVIQTSAPFKRDILKSYYTEPVRDALYELFGASFQVSFIVGELAEQKIPPAPAYRQSDYTFERFVVGKSNIYAANGAKAVAENPGQTYNPLFIYGDSGLGKTHLLYAIHNYVRLSRPDFVILDFTAETFTNELATAIRAGTTADFREKYRTPDMILVDDIQFISGKDYSQEEFFHTFNSLHEVGNQIVVTSDRPPRDMPLLEERLRSRFDAGLVVDVKPPDFETRMAIIKAKALQLSLIIDDDVIVYVAESITTNIRQLEGSVKKLTAYKDIFGKISLEEAQRAISDIVRVSPGLNPTPELVLSEVCDYFHVDEKQLLGNGRTSVLVNARQIAMYITRELTGTPLQKIGDFFRRDHTTVLYSCDKIAAERIRNLALDSQIKAITENIRGK
jgi:chromosomal replication initiator protein